MSKNQESSFFLTTKESFEGGDFGVLFNFYNDEITINSKSMCLANSVIHLGSA